MTSLPVERENDVPKVGVFLTKIRDVLGNESPR